MKTEHTLSVVILIPWVLIFIHISYTVFSATVIYTYTSCIL